MHQLFKREPKVLMQYLMLAQFENLIHPEVWSHSPIRCKIMSYCKFPIRSILLPPWIILSDKGALRYVAKQTSLDLAQTVKFSREIRIKQQVFQSCVSGQRPDCQRRDNRPKKIV